MPTLKQLTCRIESSQDNIKLTEYVTSYDDGVVTTHVMVPANSQAFSIHLTSNGYIAPGIAMFVFVDGRPQCNRNRRGLVIPDKKTDKSLFEIDFRVRQKEEKFDGKHFLGREWRFEDLQPTQGQVGKDLGLDDDVLSGIGTIEVVVLRCFGECSKSAPRGGSAIDDAFGINLDGTCDGTEQPSILSPGIRKTIPISLDGSDDERRGRERHHRHVHIYDGDSPSRNHLPYVAYPAVTHANPMIGDQGPRSPHNIRPSGLEARSRYGVPPEHLGYYPPPPHYYQPAPRNYYDRAARSYRRPEQLSPRDERNVSQAARDFWTNEQAKIQANDQQGWPIERDRSKSPSNKSNVAWGDSPGNGNNNTANNQGGAWDSNDNNDTSNNQGGAWDNNHDNAGANGVGWGGNNDNQDSWGNKDNSNDNSWEENNKQDSWGNNDNSNEKSWDNNDNPAGAWDAEASKDDQNNQGSGGWGNQNDADPSNQNGGWGDQNNTKSAGNGGWDSNAADPNPSQKVERKKKKEHSPTREVSKVNAGAQAHKHDPSRLHIKPYWTKWRGTSFDPSSADVSGRSPYVVPAEPRLAVPEKVAEDRNLSHHIQAGRGKLYQHATGTPKYMDSMEEPYAVFVFKYRSRGKEPCSPGKDQIARKVEITLRATEALQKMLPDITIKEDRVPFRERIRDLPRDDLVEMLIKAKKHAGYATDSTVRSTSSSEPGSPKKETGNDNNNNNNWGDNNAASGDVGGWD